MRHLDDKGNNEILIEKRLYSKLEKALRQVNFAYHRVISDKISSLMRDIYRKNIVKIFVKTKEKLRLTRIQSSQNPDKDDKLFI